MDNEFWHRFNNLKESINSGVEPMANVVLPTKTIKIFLGMFLFQSMCIALVWSIISHSFSPWIIPMSAFLQVGWLWNKVTDSWKIERGYYTRKGYESVYPEYQPRNSHVPFTEDSLNPPTIILNNLPNRGMTAPAAPTHPKNNQMTTELDEDNLMNTARSIPPNQTPLWGTVSGDQV